MTEREQKRKEFTAIEIYREDNRFCICGQGLFGSFVDTPVNRRVVIAFLRCLRKSESGRFLFTLKELAQIVDSGNRQAASEHAEQFRACGEDFLAFVSRQRKVDAQVVEGVLSELTRDPLAEVRELKDRVSDRLGREDLSEANITAALDQISYAQMRGVLKHQLAKGSSGIHYQEAALVEDLLCQVETGGYQKAGLTLQHQRPDRVLVDPTAIRKLLQPGACLDEVCGCVQWVCFCLALYYWGLPLSRLGLWLGVHKTTIWRWVVGLAFEIYDPIAQEVYHRIRPSIVYVDEKWIKIKGVWHYWFVVLDHATHIPIVSYLSPTRSASTCRWIGLALKKLKGHIRAVVTDGLKSYAHLLPDVRHLLCHFHHQRGITTWLKTHLKDAQEYAHLNKQMKEVLQTNDKRTVRRRLDKLEEHAEAFGITAWVTQTRENLEHLLPAVGSRILPRTTNAIERFFRQFNRFYKVRRGFASVDSAKEQLAIFLIGYLFAKRATDGRAPIETIWPEAAQTPLYQLLNDPFGVLKAQMNVKRFPEMADIPYDDLLAAG